MSVGPAVNFFRHSEQREMRSECVIERVDPSASRAYDPTTQRYVPTPTTLYTGKCLLRPGTLEGRTREQAETEERRLVHTLKLPFEAIVDLQIGDTVRVTSSPDPLMTVRSFRVIDVPKDDWQINRRCPVQEVTEVVHAS